MAIKRDTAWNVAGAIFPAVVGVLTVPYMIAQLGVERFGILTLLWAIVGYASLFDFGLGRAATQQVASRLGHSRENEVRPIAETAIFLTMVMGTLVCLLFTLMSGVLAERVFNVSPELVDEVKVALIIVATGIPLATVSNGYRGVLEAYRKFAAVNTAKIIVGTAIFLLPFLWVFTIGGGLVEVSAMLVVARVVGAVIFLKICRSLPYYKNYSVEISFSEKKSIFISGLWMGASGIVSPLLINLDRFFISNMMGAGVVAYYTTPFEFLIRILIIPGAIGASLFPRLSADYGMRPDAARVMYNRSLKITMIVMLVLCLTCGLLAAPLLTNFISAEFSDKSIWIIYILLVGIFFNGLANIPYTALHSIGAARFTGILHIGELVVYIPILIVLIKSFGLEGAAFAWTTRVTLDCMIMFLKKR